MRLPSKIRFGSILLVCLCLTTPMAFAQDTGRLPANAKFPSLQQTTPLTTSHFYVVDNAQQKNGSFNVHLDTPKGASAVVFGSDQLSLYPVNSNAKLQGLAFSQAPMDGLTLASTGKTHDLSKLAPGTHTLRISGNTTKTTKQEIMAEPDWKVIITQPESPLQLEVKAWPLIVQPGQKINVQVHLRDDHPINNVHITSDSTVSFTPTRQENTWVGELAAPVVRGQQSFDMQVSVSGNRFDGTPFIRQAATNVLVNQPTGGFSKTVYVDTDNRLLVDLKPAVGRFRVSVVYGKDDMGLAFAQEDVQLTGGTKTIYLELPEAAYAANKALVRLLNIETLGLEEQQLVALTPKMASKMQLQETLPQEIELPESKKRALHLLEAPTL